MEVFGQVPDVDEAVLVSGDQERPRERHIVDGHGDIGLADLVQLLTSLLPSPKFDSRVPPARNHDRRATLRVDEAHNVFYWLRMLAYLHNLIRLQVELFDRVVRAGKQNGNCVYLPAHAQDRAVDLLHRLLLDLGRPWVDSVVRVLHLEHQHRAVPGRRCQHPVPNLGVGERHARFGHGRECKVRDCIC